MSRSLKESRALYAKLAGIARIPHEFVWSTRWKSLSPQYYRSTFLDGAIEQKYVRIPSSEQRKWITKFTHNTDHFLKPYLIAFISRGISLPARQLAYGLACKAIRDGLSVKTYYSPWLSFNGNEEDKEIGKHNIIVLDRVHTTDTQIRKQITRDFIQKREETCRFLIVAGKNPLEYIQDDLDIMPHAVFHIPPLDLQPRLFR